MVDYNGIPGLERLYNRPSATTLGNDDLLYVEQYIGSVYRSRKLSYPALLAQLNASVTLPTYIPATNIADGTVSNANFQYLSGVTSNIQTQLNAKQSAITLTTTGTTGAASFVGNILNIPQYAGTIYTGTTNRITVAGSVIDISASYVGQSSITTLGTIGTGTWQGTKIAEIYGGTNQATYTLGDTLYSSAANTLSKLAGNITTTNKFLSQTGTGSVSAAPVWCALVSSDIPNNAANTTGSAAKWTTARTLGGNSVDGSANVAFSNKFIVQGTSDAGLSGAQFLGALGTGLVKNTTTTGVLSIATAGTDYQAPITLTTTGSSGAATFVGNTLNIPQYTGGGGGSGDVVGPASATDNAMVRFDTTTGKLIQNSGVLVDDNNNISTGLGAIDANVGLQVGAYVAASTNKTAFFSSGIIPSGITGTFTGYKTGNVTAASAFTVGTYNHYLATQASLGAGSAVTAQYGFRAGALSNAGSNYGFYSESVAATGVYNFYAAGTAQNFFAGDTGIGTAATTTSYLSLGASTTGLSSLNLSPGVAPISPVNGDIWLTSSHIFARIGGSTFQLDQQASTGTVTTVSVTTANGISGIVATPTTTPAITLTLGAITPSSIASTGTVTGTNLSGTNTGDQTTITGNAGTATKWATARTLAGNTVDGSANVAFANKFIVQGTVDTGLSGAQFLGALGTGIVKNTTTTGVLSIAIASDFPTLNQNTTGSAATLTTSRNIYGNAFNGSADVTGTVAGLYGGTGVANTGKTITLGGNFTTAGAFATTLTVTATTNVTLPTTGTLATIAGAETPINKTINGLNNTITNIAGTLLNLQKFTTSGTYTPTTGTTKVVILAIGGGSGGGGSGTGATAGGAGTATSVGTIAVAGTGTGGAANGGGKGSGGIGTTGSVLLSGGDGCQAIGIVGNASVGHGGVSHLGGNGTGVVLGAGGAGQANTGSGGAGGSGSTTVTGGSGGGAGGYSLAYVTGITGTYTVTIGAGGTAGAAGTSGFAGGAGGAGLAIIYEYV